MIRSNFHKLLGKRIPKPPHLGPEESPVNVAASSATAESRKFTGDVIWFAVAQLFVSIILGIVTLPALTKSYGPLIYGIWIQMNVTVDFVSPLLSLQLGLSTVRFLAGEEDSEKRRRALGVMLSAITGVVLTASAAGILFAKPLSTFLFNNSGSTVYIQLLILWVAFNCLFNFLQSYLRARSRIKEISIIQILLTSLKVLAILVLATQRASIDSIFIAMVTLQILFTGVILSLIIKETGVPIPGIRGLGTLVYYGLPQTPVIILLWAVTLSDRYFITKFAGLSDTAVYSSSAMLAGLIALFYSPISLVLFPQIARMYARNRKVDAMAYLEFSTKMFLTLAVPAAIGVAAVSQLLLKVLTTPDFLAGREIVFLLAMGAVFLGLFQININVVLVERYARWLPVVTCTAYLSSVIMNLILVPRFGILGAAISNCSSFFLIAAATTVWVRSTLPYRLSLPYLGKVAASAGFMLLGLMFFKVENFFQMILAIVGGFGVFGVGLVLFRGFSLKEGISLKKTITEIVKSMIGVGPNG